MKKTYLFLMAIFLIGTLEAQPYFGVHFITSSPYNTFCDSAYRQGYGVNFELFSNNLLRKSVNPNVFDLRLGLGFDFQGAGREKRSVILNTPNSDPGKEKFSNSHFGIRTSMRMTFLGEKRFSPYIDLFGGFRQFNSTRTIEIDKAITDFESSTSNRVLSKWTSRYGASLGAMYRINSVVYLDTRITYSAGTANEWLNLNTVTRRDNEVSYHISNTTTDLFTLNLGLSFRFVKSRKKASNSSPQPNAQPSNSASPQPKASPKKTPTKVTPKPKPTPKKPLEVKPTPPKPPKPKPKPEN